MCVLHVHCTANADLCEVTVHSYGMHVYGCPVSVQIFQLLSFRVLQGALTELSATAFSDNYYVPGPIGWGHYAFLTLRLSVCHMPDS